MKKEERLTLVKFIDSAVEQVTEVFQLNEEDSQKFRDAFSEIAVIDILSRFTNASDGNQKCYAFTSASNVMTPNIMQALSNANLPTLLPEGRCLLTKMIPVDDKTKSEAIALKEQLKKEGRFRLNLVEFIDLAVEQVTEVFDLDKGDSQRFRDAFSEIAITDILSNFTNASDGNRECYAFTSAGNQMTSNITKALSKVNLSTVLPEGRCLLTKMVPVDDITKSEAIALKEQLKKEGRFRLTLVEFIESAVEQVTEVFNLNEEDSQNFRNAFSEIAVEDILAGFVNAFNGYQECYAFTSACSMMTTNITKALSKVNLSTVLPEGRCLLGTMIPADEVTRLEAIALKDQMATTKKSEEDKVKKYVK